MARALPVVKVAVEYVGTETGLWCNDCMLSTGARISFTGATSRDGFAETSLYQALFCTECGGREVAP